jgi:hypothetical protein
MTKSFKVVALSENTNSFGLREAYTACKNPQFMPEHGATVEVPFILDKDGEITDKVCFSSLGFEIPEKQRTAPPELVDEMFNNLV